MDSGNPNNFTPESRDGYEMDMKRIRERSEAEAIAAITLENKRLRAENEALKASAQNVRILKAVDSLDPASTQYVHAVLVAVDRAEAAEAKLAAVEKEREEALDQAGEHAAVASALQERVKELRAANERDRDQWAEDIEKVPALTAKVASMEKVVEAAILYRDSIRNGSSGLEAVNPAAGIFDRAVHALSRLPAPEK